MPTEKIHQVRVLSQHKVVAIGKHKKLRFNTHKMTFKNTKNSPKNTLHLNPNLLQIRKIQNTESQSLSETKTSDHILQQVEITEN